LTWFVHNVPNVTISELKNIGLPGANQADADRVASLQVHGALYKSLNYSGKFIRGKPFFELPKD
jgi:DNA phosphorothioation-dependent restriction protein DptH